MTFPPTTRSEDSKRSYSDREESEDEYSRLSSWTKCRDTKVRNEDADHHGVRTTKAPYIRMNVVDESLLLPEEAEALFAKRAYNRDSAKRARYRRKQLIEDLNLKVRELEDDKTELRRSLKEMETMIEKLNNQNKNLQIKVLQLRCNKSTYVGRKVRVPLPATIPGSSINLVQSLYQQKHATFGATSMYPSPSSLSASLEYLKFLHKI